MIEAAETVFTAMAFEQCIRPVVEGYQRKVLAERTWATAPERMIVLQRRSDQPLEQHITDIKSAWMMSEADFAVYLRRCNEERMAANLCVESDNHCPLRVAEDLTRQARGALFDVMASITGIPAAKAVTMRMADYNKMVDLTLKLLAPFVTNPLPKLAA
jgi:hypothetical protein